MPTAKVFQNGNSQAVRLPREFRFPEGVDEVTIRRQGDRIILEPLEGDAWPEDFWRAFEGLSPDFERPRQNQPPGTAILSRLEDTEANSPNRLYRSLRIR